MPRGLVRAVAPIVHYAVREHAHGLSLYHSMWTCALAGALVGMGMSPGRAMGTVGRWEQASVVPLTAYERHVAQLRGPTMAVEPGMAGWMAAQPGMVGHPAMAVPAAAVPAPAAWSPTLQAAQAVDINIYDLDD